jgi:carboxymethylenebutenolidase
MEVTSTDISINGKSAAILCHLAIPTKGGPYPVLLVAMEAWGLNEQIKKMADRFAAEGFIAIVPDLYHRQPDNVVEYNDLAKGFRLMATVKDDEIVADMTAAIDYLRTLEVVAPSFGTVGFCMGGSAAFVTACRIPQVRATVPFYGAGLLWPSGPGEKARAEYLPSLTAPVLAFFGGKDAFIPASEVDKFRDALAAAGKQAKVIVYPDADHGFMNEQRPSYNPVHSADAWARTIAFFKSHLN